MPWVCGGILGVFGVRFAMSFWSMLVRMSMMVDPIVIWIFMRSVFTFCFILFYHESWDSRILRPGAIRAKLRLLKSGLSA
jgi:hypothetical protein